MLIAFSGLKGSGKDTAASVLVEEYGFIRVAFADAVRDVAIIINPCIPLDGMWGVNVVRLSQLVYEFGWDKIKREIPEVRRLLQSIGTEAGRYLLGEDVWINVLSNRFPDIGDESAKYVITDCRFPNEARFIDTNNGSIIWISRPGLQSDGHASESETMKSWRNWEIINDGDINQLKQKVRKIMMAEGAEPIE